MTKSYIVLRVITNNSDQSTNEVVVQTENKMYAIKKFYETLADAAGKIATDYNELGIPNGRLADICYILNNENKVEGHAGFVAELPKKE